VAFNFPFEVEHITPSDRGGDDALANLALSCRSCNIYKANHLDAVDPLSGERVRLFNPRTDHWTDHFAVNDNDEITALTPVGSATATLLRFNTPAQLEARQWWRTLQLFP
jgi:5-methylcytosine-specific restriction endonuclease McrA